MPQYIGEGISHRGLIDEGSHFPFYIAAGVVAADVGKAMSLDTTAATTVKLAADGEVILGALASFENRLVEGLRVGTVPLRGGETFTRAAGAPAVTVGASICGAGAGEVRAALVGDATVLKRHNNIVTAVNGTAITAIFF